MYYLGKQDGDSGDNVMLTLWRDDGRDAPEDVPRTFGLVIEVLQLVS